MTVDLAEKVFMRDKLPKRRGMCQHQQQEQDRKLLEALVLEFVSADIAERAMRVIKGMR